MKCDCIDISTIQFNVDDVPTTYQWSGYCKDSAEFKKYNFLHVGRDYKSVYICSEENGVGLGDYLSRFIFKQTFIYEMEGVYSPGYDYWFFQAWERAEPWYDMLDNWIQEIIEMLVKKGLIKVIEKEETKFFVFSMLSDFENSNCEKELCVEAEKICKKDLLQHFEDDFSDYDDIDELSIGDGGEWAQAILEEFIQNHLSNFK